MKRSILVTCLLVITMVLTGQNVVQAQQADAPAALIPIPTQYAPAQDVTQSDETVTYIWEHSSGLTKYSLEVKQVSSGSTIHQSDYDAATYCDDTLCTVPVGDSLAVGDYEWRISAWENETQGSWSGYIVFSIIDGFTRMISLSETGEIINDDINNPAITPDGAYAIYSSSASNVVSNDTNSNYDCFLINLNTDEVEVVSQNADGEIGNGYSQCQSISSDGRYVAFGSDATNLLGSSSAVPANESLDGVGPIYDLYLKDRQTGSVTLISQGHDGGAADASTNAESFFDNNQYLLVLSEASNLTADADTNAARDVFIYTIADGSLEYVPVTYDGSLAEYGISWGYISADGRYLTFNSLSTNIIENDNNGKSDTFYLDRDTNTVYLASKSPLGAQANESSSVSAISADGNFILFTSEATNLVDGDTNGYDDAFLYDRVNDTIERISLATNRDEANQNTRITGGLSADGRFASISSDASNLITGTTFSQASSVYVYDRVTKNLRHVSETYTGDIEGGDSWGFSGNLSANGQFMVYESYATNLVEDNYAGTWNLLGRAFITDLSKLPLKAPTTSTPAASSTSYGSPASFIWDVAPHADYYVVEVENTADFSSEFTDTYLASDTCDQYTCTLPSPTTLEIGNYQWRVKGYSDLSGGTWSDWSAFSVADAQLADFVITIQTSTPSWPYGNYTSDTEFNIPTYYGETYNYNVDCDNDGTNEAEGVTSDYICEYETSGDYTIRIKDNVGDGTGFPRIYFNLTGDRMKILAVEQWGNGKWTSMEDAFSGCSFLSVPAADAPDLSGVTSLARMFSGAMGARRINDEFPDANFNNWDTSTITSMSETFRDSGSFIGTVDAWDTSNVTDMSKMFYNNESFNQDLSGWNTGNVIDMNGMFYYNRYFDQDLSSWDVSSLTNASDMFGDTALSTGNYDALLTSWNAQALQDGVTFGAGNSTYCLAGDARSNMVNNDHWSITDGGYSCALAKPKFYSPQSYSRIEDLTPTFDWTDVYQATGYVFQYSTDLSFTSPVEVNTVDSTFTPDNDLAPGEYYARVKAINAETESDWSVVLRSLTVAGSPFWSDEFGYNDGWGGDQPRSIGDVNGDGFNDIIGFSANGVMVALGHIGTSFETATMWLPGAFGSNPAAGGWGGENTIRTVADVNGDYKADLIGFGNFGVLVSLSDGTSFGAPTYWTFGYGSDASAGGWSSTENNRVVADVNGDGMADIVGFGSFGVLVSLSTGSSFTDGEYWVMGYGSILGGWDGIQNPRMIADVNGDGCGDVVGFSNWGVLVSLSNACGGGFPSNSFGTATYWTLGYAYLLGDWDSTHHIRTFGDVDGDGDADLVGFGDYGVLVSLSNGAGSFGAASYWKMGYGYIMGGWDVYQHPRVIADVDDWGEEDIIGFASDGVIVARSDGTSFE